MFSQTHASLASSLQTHAFLKLIHKRRTRQRRTRSLKSAAPLFSFFSSNPIPNRRRTHIQSNSAAPPTVFR
nr:hypothetical protein CFP56_64401 [Quercus suber]